jgi:hypothetical protein
MRKFKELGYGKEKEREICFIAVFVNGKHVDDIYEKSRNKPKK